jgi:hypothetical protein
LRASPAWAAISSPSSGGGVVLPPLHLNQAGREKVQPVEETVDLGMAARRRAPGLSIISTPG